MRINSILYVKMYENWQVPRGACAPTFRGNDNGWWSAVIDRHIIRNWTNEQSSEWVDHHMLLQKARLIQISRSILRLDYLDNNCPCHRRVSSYRLLVIGYYRWRPAKYLTVLLAQRREGSHYGCSTCSYFFNVVLISVDLKFHVLFRFLSNSND